jgi:signal transduction histidine kinase/DNA-binding LacI/PurR family transcriptional regulator/DNA-binding response OmpR family regulator
MKEKKNRKTIAYVAPFIWGDISLTYFKGVLDTLKEEDSNIVFYIGNRLEDSKDFSYQGNMVYRLMSEEWIDGILIWASQIAETLPVSERRKIANRFPKVPMVTIAGSIDEADAVYGDDRVGMQLLIEHLYRKHQCTKLAFIQGPENHPLSIVRKEGFYLGLQKNNLILNEEYISKPGGFNLEHGMDAIKDFYVKSRGLFEQDIDGIICASDIIALGAMEQLESYGIKVPEDIKVVGVNNKTDSRISTPPMTTIDPKTQQIGRCAANELFQRIQNPQKKFEEIHVKAKLVIRNSCGCKEIELDEVVENTKEFDRLLLHSIQEEFCVFFEDFSEVLGKEFGEKWLQAFCSDLEAGDGNLFIGQLKDALLTLKRTDMDLQIFQNAISYLRSHMIFSMHSKSLRLHAESIWNQARVEIALSREHQFAEHKSKTDNFLFFLNEFNEKLRTTFIFEEVLEIIEGLLPKAGIPGCYIALLNEENMKQGKADLVFSYVENKRNLIPEGGVLFPYQQLLPIDCKKRENRFCFIVHALYYQDTIIGYIVFEAGPIDKSIYTILSNEISSAIYRTRIFDSLKESEMQREVLLHNLETENLNLEKRIEERTTAIQSVNIQLEKAIREANMANEAKSRFLANMSHEIRTPLNGILGFTDLIIELTKDDEALNYLRLAKEEAEKLMVLINELLDLSKIEAGHIEIQQEYFDLNGMLQGIQSQFSVLAKEKALFFETKTNISNIHVLGDELRIRQVLTNLIGNAIKFTKQGGITLGCIYEPLEQNIDNNQWKCILRFEVKDTGIGIEKERLDAIFEPFVQEDGTTTRNFGGTGLGTSISKQLVELMGGTIGVESIKGEGSLFWFAIPMNYVNRIEQAEPFIEREIEDSIEELHIRNCQILVVDDYKPNQVLVMNYLKQLPCHIDIAENGMMAVEKQKRKAYDLILMDVQMPVMDGMEATRIIRETEGPNHITIIGITANAFASDLQQYKEVGMDNVITKPFRKQELQSIVMKELQKVHQRPCQTGKLLYELDHDTELFSEIFQVFFDSGKQYIAEMEQALQQQDFKKISWNAHALKGAAYNLFAEAIGDAAANLEKVSKNEDPVDYEKKIEQIKYLFQELIAYIRKVNR